MRRVLVLAVAAIVMVALVPLASAVDCYPPGPPCRNDAGIESIVFTDGGDPPIEAGAANGVDVNGRNHGSNAVKVFVKLTARNREFPTKKPKNLAFPKNGFSFFVGPGVPVTGHFNIIPREPGQIDVFGTVTAKRDVHRQDDSLQVLVIAV